MLSVVHLTMDQNVDLAFYILLAVPASTKWIEKDVATCAYTRSIYRTWFPLLLYPTPEEQDEKHPLTLLADYLASDESRWWQHDLAWESFEGLGPSREELDGKNLFRQVSYLFKK